MAPPITQLGTCEVTYWQDFSSEEAESYFQEIKADLSLSDEFSFHEDWQEFLSEGDWVLDFFMESDRPKYQGLWQILPSPHQERNLSLARKRRDFVPDGFGILKIAESDLEQLGEAADHFISAAEDTRNAVVSLKVVVDYIDNVRRQKHQRASQTKPTDLQSTRLKERFDAAMFKIYEDAKAAGYSANRFLEMIQRSRPIDVARRLALDPTPSPGFLNLKFLNRIDLTVEHLVVQDPWSTLFEPEVIAAAKRKLKQHSGS